MIQQRKPMPKADRERLNARRYLWTHPRDTGLRVPRKTAAEQDWESNHAAQFRRSTNPKSKNRSDGGNGTILSRLLAKARLR